MSTRVLDVLKEKFGSSILETHSNFGDDTAIVDAEKYKDICRFLRDDAQMDMKMCVDLCGADYPDRLPRFEVVLHLYSLNRRHRVRIKTRVGDEDGENVSVDSVTD